MKHLQRFFRLAAVPGVIFTGCQMPAMAENTINGDQVHAEIRLYLWNTVGTALWTERAKAPSAKEDGSVDKEYFLPKGKEYDRVKCVPQSYSEPINYKGSRKFQLYRKGTPNEAAYVPVAETMLPTGNGRYVMFLDGGNTNPRILVFPYDAGAVAKGQMLLFNATDRGLAIRVASDKKSIAPNALAKFSVAAFTDYQMPIEIFEWDNQNWIPRVSTRCAIRFDEKNLGLLYQRPNDKEVAFTLLPIVAWEAKAP